MERLVHTYRLCEGNGVFLWLLLKAGTAEFPSRAYLAAWLAEILNYTDEILGLSEVHR